MVSVARPITIAFWWEEKIEKINATKCKVVLHLVALYAKCDAHEKEKEGDVPEILTYGTNRGVKSTVDSYTRPQWKSIVSITTPKTPKKNTAVNYQVFLAKFNEQFGERELHTITSEEILSFVTRLGENTNQTTKRHRYSLLNAFFNLVKNTI